MLTKAFLTAGQATFTIEHPALTERPAGHFTYRIEKVEKPDRWPEAYFVKVLTGPQNTEDYTYAGKLDVFTGQMVLTAKSAFPATALRVRLLNRVLARIWADDHAAYESHGYKVHHEGKCGCCGRTLTTPQSVTDGLGPICRKAMVEAGQIDW